MISSGRSSIASTTAPSSPARGGERLKLIPAAAEHIYQQDEKGKRYLDAVTSLSKAFALVVPDPAAIEIRDEVAFFQTVRSMIAKVSGSRGKSPDELDGAIKQLVSEAVITEGLIDILDVAGLKTPDISILSDEFLAEIRSMPQRNLAMELLQKLLKDEIKARSRRNLVQARKFSEMLEETVRRYQNRSLDAAQVILELIELAKIIQTSVQKGEELGLNEDELAFYDALAANQSAVDVMGDKQLAVIAMELLVAIRNNVTIDWQIKHSARAKIRVMVKRLLKKYGYPPDLREEATKIVLQQAELLAASWVG